MTIVDFDEARRQRTGALSLVAAPRLVLAGETGARLLAGPPAREGRESLESHRARLGSVNFEDLDPVQLRATVRESGLLGRGGGGFPTATKFDVAAQSPGTPIIVVNASEGEPASRKDQTLLELRPHVVLDGAQFAAAAVRAADIVIYTHATHAAANESLRAALAEREPSSVRIRLVNAPDTYIAGETSAVVSYLDGRGAIPSRGVIPAARVGIGQRPTIVNNVETLAHLALIARRGAAWFAEVGAPEAPGSSLLTLVGAVREPGLVVEVVGPTTLGEVLEVYGGLRAAPRAVLLGGYEGSWIPGEDAWRTPVERHRLARLGISLGCGVVAVIGEEMCGLAQTARLVAWLASQSAGQCGPCIFGLPSLSEQFDAVVAGRARKSDVRKLRELATSVRGRGACGHPTGVVTLVESALDTFTSELKNHLRGEVCAAVSGAGGFPLPEGEDPR
ncbi:MAG: proton-conducting membrane transporter [Acidimicrobiaceae bacterium]|nr:proton-conducting membrane transporter [Acidimicrobiaceae bacterium]